MLRATTFFSKNSDALLKSVVSTIQCSHGSNVAYCVPANLPTDNLSSLVTHLSKTGRHTAGCIAAPFPSELGQYSCSVLEMSTSISSPFVSNVPGRPTVQVGRYHHMHTNQHRKSDEAWQRKMDQTLLGKQDWTGPDVTSVPPGWKHLQYGTL
jgi:hypothetical protein